MRIPERWIFQLTDFDRGSTIKNLLQGYPVSIISYDEKMCCSLQGMEICNECPRRFNIQENFFKTFLLMLINHLKQLAKEGMTNIYS